jgi:hypothetical protein
MLALQKNKITPEGMLPLEINFEANTQSTLKRTKRLTQSSLEDFIYQPRNLFQGGVENGAKCKIYRTFAITHEELYSPAGVEENLLLIKTQSPIPNVPCPIPNSPYLYFMDLHLISPIFKVLLLSY